MKILILINNEFTLYNFRQELLHILAAAGNDVIISMPLGQYDDLFREMGCRVRNIELSQHGMNPIRDLMLLKHYYRIIKKEKPHIILTYTIKPNIYGGIAAGLCNIPCISTVTGLGAAFERGSLIKKVSLMLYKFGTIRTRCVFFQNRAQSWLFANHRIAVNRHRIVSGSGVNLQKHCFEPYPKGDELRLLFVGRIMQDKGIGELIDAMRIVRNRSNIKVSLELLGNIDNKYLNLIKSCETEGLLISHGRHDNVHDYVKDCHAVVLPSYHEGLSNALLEAAATGRPIIATRIPGCIEAFEDGITGLGCNVRDAIDLAKTIMQFSELSYEQRALMGIKGREKMEREFDRNVVNGIYLKEIQKAVGEH